MYQWDFAILGFDFECEDGKGIVNILMTYAACHKYLNAFDEIGKRRPLLLINWTFFLVLPTRAIMRDYHCLFFVVLRISIISFYVFSFGLLLSYSVIFSVRTFSLSDIFCLWSCGKCLHCT